MCCKTAPRSVDNVLAAAGSLHQLTRSKLGPPLQAGGSVAICRWALAHHCSRCVQPDVGGSAGYPVRCVLSRHCAVAGTAVELIAEPQWLRSLSQ